MQITPKMLKISKITRKTQFTLKWKWKCAADDKIQFMFASEFRSYCQTHKNQIPQISPVSAAYYNIRVPFCLYTFHPILLLGWMQISASCICAVLQYILINNKWMNAAGIYNSNSFQLFAIPFQFQFKANASSVQSRLDGSSSVYQHRSIVEESSSLVEVILKSVHFIVDAS